jgi:hypothetical protein
VTDNANTFVVFTDALSVTCTVKPNGLPMVFVGVPVSMPDTGSKVAQLGIDPAMIAQFVYGGVPPVAANVWLYAVATLASGSGDAVVIVSGMAGAVTAQFTV